MFFAVFLFPPAYAADTCVDCHKDVKFRVLNKKLFDYYNNWNDSVHDLADVKCINCHGGNPTVADKDASHKDHFSSFKADGKDSYKVVPDKCGKCHKEVLKNFIESKHYKALIEKKTGPNCVTCHGSMSTEIYNISNIAKGCALCHNEETKNIPEAGSKAENFLQSINISRAYKKWATIYYSGSQPKLVEDINAQYKDIVFSWHSFNFERIDEKSMKLLNELKALVNKKLAEKRKQKK